ncbi:MAG: helix-turn-helix domain-containing protein [Candidatus Gastranaerophilales bacterium]|nr:helix-turn-helix domain-containing protein [Candidatus Gastranaerophilales bacterium]
MIDDVFLKEFGLRLKMFRIKSGLTQAELGELTDISEHRISDIENGKCNLTLKTVNRISNAINVQVHKLFIFDNS